MRENSLVGPITFLSISIFALEFIFQILKLLDERCSDWLFNFITTASLSYVGISSSAIF
jgi:hypothetical protein